MDVADQRTGQRNLRRRAVTDGDTHQIPGDHSLDIQPVGIERRSGRNGVAHGVHGRIHRRYARAHPGRVRHQHRVTRHQRCLDNAHEQEHQERQQQGQLDGGLPLLPPRA